MRVDNISIATKIIICMLIVGALTWSALKFVYNPFKAPTKALPEHPQKPGNPSANNSQTVLIDGDTDVSKESGEDEANSDAGSVKRSRGKPPKVKPRPSKRRK